MTRRCPRPGCTAQIPWFKFACRADWFALPANIRIDLNAAWQERVAGGDAAAHLAACATAMAWYRANTPAATP